MGYQLTLRKYSQDSLIRVNIDSDHIEAVLKQVKELIDEYHVLKIKKLIPIVTIDEVLSIQNSPSDH